MCVNIYGCALFMCAGMYVHMYTSVCTCVFECLCVCTYVFVGMNVHVFAFSKSAFHLLILLFTI